MYVMGDFNLNLLKYKTDNNIQRYLDILNSSGFIPLNKVLPKHATRIATINNKTTKTVIDHISTDILSVPYFFSIHDFFRSDHRVLVLNIKMKNIPPSTIKKNITVLNYNKIDLMNLSLKIEENKSIDDLKEVCKLTILKNTKTFETEVKVNEKNPWITRELIINKKKRDKFYKLKIKYPNTIFFLNNLKFMKNYEKNVKDI